MKEDTVMTKGDKELRGILGCLAVVFVPILGIALVAIANDYLSPLPYTQSLELKSYVTELSEGKPQGGKSPLPEKLKRFSNDGHCYVTAKSNGLILVFFPANTGIWDTYGYLHASRPLQPTDYLSPKKVKGPDPMVAAQTEVGNYALAIRTRFADNWYQAVRKFD
jgi:hypothetical protein